MIGRQIHPPPPLCSSGLSPTPTPPYQFFPQPLGLGPLRTVFKSEVFIDLELGERGVKGLDRADPRGERDGRLGEKEDGSRLGDSRTVVAA